MNGARAVEALMGFEVKRLMYRDPDSKTAEKGKEINN